MCGLTACSMLFTMPALAWAADEPQNTNIDNGLIAYYDFENVNEKKVPNVKDQSKYEGELKGSNMIRIQIEKGKIQFCFSRADRGVHFYSLRKIISMRLM